jgi:hypothetical protein
MTTREAMMEKIEVGRLLSAVGDEAWHAIDKSMQAGGTVEDVFSAVLLVHVAISAERRFGHWCAKIHDIEMTYLDGLALRLQELDDGDIPFAQCVANAIGRAREACGE